MTDAPATCAARKQRRLPGCGAIVLAAIALLTIAGIVGYRLYHATPKPWLAAQQHRQQTPAADRYHVAENFEKHLLAEVSFSSDVDDHGRPVPDASDMRHVLLPVEHVNAWLDQRLPQWLDNRGIDVPAQLSEPACWIDDRRIMLGVRVRSGQLDRVVSLAVTVDVSDDGGDLTVRPTGAWIGRLPVPLRLLRRTLHETDPRAARLLSGRKFPPLLQFGGEDIRLIDVQPTDAGLLIVIRKESP